MTDESGPDRDTTEPEPQARDDAELAPAYRRALNLDAAGASNDEIAEAIGIPVESVPVLLRLARAKSLRP